MTVPLGIRSASAASAYVKPATSTAATTSRRWAGRLPISA